MSATFRLTGITLEEGDVINILCYGSDENPQISSVWMADRDWISTDQDMARPHHLRAQGSSVVADDKAGWIALANGGHRELQRRAGEIDYESLVVDPTTGR
jgi:hypothetical protein